MITWSDVKSALGDWWHTAGLLPQSLGVAAPIVAPGKVLVSGKQAAEAAAGAAISAGVVAGPGRIAIPALGRVAGSVTGGLGALGSKLGALKRHPVGTVLTSGTSLTLGKRLTTEVYRGLKRSKKAAARAKIAADKAALREQVKAAKAEAKAAKLSAKQAAKARPATRTKGSGSRRVLRKRGGPRKLTAKQLKYFGTKKQRRAAA